MEWIKSKDNLPPTNLDVIFYEDNRYHIGHFYGTTDGKFPGRELWQSYIDSYNCMENVEYWAYIEPPKN